MCWDVNGRTLCKTMLAHKSHHTYLLAIQTRPAIYRGMRHAPVASSGAMTSWPPFTVAVASVEHCHRCRHVRCCRFPRPRTGHRRQGRRNTHQGRRHPRPSVVRRRPERLVVVTVAAVVVAHGFETASLSEGTALTFGCLSRRPGVLRSLRRPRRPRGRRRSRRRSRRSRPSRPPLSHRLPSPRSLARPLWHTSCACANTCPRLPEFRSAR